MMSLHPKIIDLTLDRVWRLLQAVDHPEQMLPPVVHIAGTNGKGSTLAMIRAGMQAADQRVHAYTSPHLARFHERILLAGELITEDHLTDILDECDRANGGDSITYFEITTCAALLAFARTQADFTLLEVGLGGRLDATNVVEKPALTIITPISIDHQSYLGDTLPEIAAEKAGILKRNVPCIVGPQTDEGLHVIEDRAARLGAPLLVHGQHWHVTEERGRMIYQDETGLLDLPLPNLIGAHQVQNAGAALAALRALGFGETACNAAMTDVTWPARMQRLKTGPLVNLADKAELWLDGGHNTACADAIAETVTRLSNRPLHLICGMLNTKDVLGYMQRLADVANSLHAVSIPNEANTLSAQDTRDAAAQAGITATATISVSAAIVQIVSGTPNARILICGSLYLAGHILRENA